MLVFPRDRYGLVSPRRIAPQWLAFRPRVVIAAASPRLSLLGAQALSFANDAAVLRDYFEFPGVNGYVEASGSGTVDPWSHTVLCVCQLDAFPASGYAQIGGYPTTSTRRGIIYAQSDANYTDVCWGKSDGAGSPGATGTKYSLSGIASVTGARHQFVLRGNGATNGTGGSGWCNGRPLTASGGGQFGSASGNATLGQLSTAGGANDFDGRIWLFALFDSRLPDGACQQLSARPERLLAKRRRLWAHGFAAAAANAYNPLSGRGGAAAQPLVMH